MTYVVDRGIPGGALIAAGLAPGWTVVHKFGRIVNPGSAFVPVAFTTTYQMVQPASATALRVKAGDANDTAAGSGAREVTVQGLDETGAEVTEALATAGASASSNSSATFTRLYRAFVSASGTYATGTTGSHAANVVIENAAGSADWATIDVTDHPRAQSEIACYTLPTGQTGYISDITITVDGNQRGDIALFQRTNAIDDSAPYDAMREVGVWVGVAGELRIQPVTPFGSFAAGTDLIFMGRAAGNTTISIDFEILRWDGT
jgi:hypothetical protein